jgi:hypothetical protein
MLYCLADGTFGHEHIRNTLAETLFEWFDIDGDDELYVSLRGEMPDDAWDELKAIEEINSHSEAPGVLFMQDGDLMVLVEE